VRRNDPTTGNTEFSVDYPPRGYFGRLGIALAANTHVSSLQLWIWHRFLTRQELETILIRTSPALSFLRSSESLRKVVLEGTNMGDNDNGGIRRGVHLNVGTAAKHSNHWQGCRARSILNDLKLRRIIDPVSQCHRRTLQFSGFYERDPIQHGFHCRHYLVHRFLWDTGWIMTLSLFKEYNQQHYNRPTI
jgi:hypothetical protein